MLLQTRMLLHPIYQQLLEGCYDPSGLSTTTKRMLLHPIFQLLLEGGYNPLSYRLLLKGCFYTLFISYYLKEATTPLLEYSLPQHHPTTLVCFYQTSRSPYIFNTVTGFSLLPWSLSSVFATWIWTIEMTSSNIRLLYIYISNILS